MRDMAKRTRQANFYRVCKANFVPTAAEMAGFHSVSGGACSSFAIYLFFSRSPHVSNPPQAIAISVCPDVSSDVHRIRSDFGIRFDAPEKAFTVHAGLRDMPTGTLYVVKLKDADAKVVVWRDDDMFSYLKIAYPVFSEHTEERNIRDATGPIFGTDRCGYLRSGERWRYVRFSTFTFSPH